MTLKYGLPNFLAVVTIVSVIKVQYSGLEDSMHAYIYV